MIITYNQLGYWPGDLVFVFIGASTTPPVPSLPWPAAAMFYTESTAKHPCYVICPFPLEALLCSRTGLTIVTSTRASHTIFADPNHPCIVWSTSFLAPHGIAPQGLSKLSSLCSTGYKGVAKASASPECRTLLEAEKRTDDKNQPSPTECCACLTNHDSTSSSNRSAIVSNGLLRALEL